MSQRKADQRIVKYISLTNGYVESVQMGHTLFRNKNSEPLDYLEAFKDLAKSLFEHYLERTGYSERSKEIINYKTCCQQAIKNPQCSFCSGCGKNLQDDIFDFLEYERYLNIFPCMSLDEYEFGDDFSGLRNWYPYVSVRELLENKCKPSELLTISSQAEKFLIAVLELEPVIMTDRMRKAWDAWNRYYGNAAGSFQDNLVRIASGMDPLD